MQDKLDQEKLDPKKLDFGELCMQLKDNLSAVLKTRGIANPVMVGVQTGGILVAKRLHKELKIDEPLSGLNINFYRDDFSQNGLHPRVGRSDIKTPLDDRHIILVDDVLHSGRTVRAALNELFDYGRAKSVVLAILISRDDGRELPIQADAYGASMKLDAGSNIKLNPETSTIEIV